AFAGLKQEPEICMCSGNILICCLHVQLCGFAEVLRHATALLVSVPKRKPRVRIMMVRRFLQPMDRFVIISAKTAKREYSQVQLRLRQAALRGFAKPANCFINVAVNPAALVVRRSQVVLRYP